MKKILIFSSLLVLVAYASAQDHKEKHKEEHKHSEGEEHGAGDTHDQSGDEKGHDEHEGNGDHEEEGSSQVGPDKGILDADEHEGIKLGPEAEKNFEIVRQKISGTSTSLPKGAIVTAGTEVNLYRYRDGFYKRIDFLLVTKDQDKVVVQSKDLSPGDEVVTKGTGFIRIAEIAAFGGAPEGHSH